MNSESSRRNFLAASLALPAAAWRSHGRSAACASLRTESTREGETDYRTAGEDRYEGIVAVFRGA